MTASAASHSISSEINPQGGKTEPRSDRRYRGEEEGRRDGGKERRAQTTAGRLGRPVRLSLEEENTLIFRGALR